MTRSLGGRVRGQRTSRRHFPKRGAANAVAPPDCLNESFAGDGPPMGADLTWVEWHVADPEYSGSTDGFFGERVTTTDPDDTLRLTHHRVGGRLELWAPDDSQFTTVQFGAHAGTLCDQWERAFGSMMASERISSADMRVECRIDSVPTMVAVGSQGFRAWEVSVYARSRNDIDEFVFGSGWQALFFQSRTFWDVGILADGFTILDSIAFDGALAADDVVGIEVIGTGLDTVVTATLNGYPLITPSPDDINDYLTLVSLTPDDLPNTDRRAGVDMFGRAQDRTTHPPFASLGWNHATMDGELATDDFEACAIAEASVAPPNEHLILHLRGSEGVVASGSNLVSWADLSQYGNDATVGGAPQTGTRDVNGWNAIDFDGVDDFVSGVVADVPAHHDGSGEARCTVYLVGIVDAVAANGVWLGLGGASIPYFIQWRGASPRFVRISGDGTLDSSFGEPSLGVPFLLRAVFAGAGDPVSATITIDGSTIATGSTGRASPWGGYVLGGGASGSGFGNMAVAELRVYDDLLIPAEDASVVSELHALYDVGE